MKVSVSPLNIEVGGEKFSYVVQQIIAENGATTITLSSSEDELSCSKIQERIIFKYNVESRAWEPETTSVSLLPEILEVLQSRFLKPKSE